MLETEETMSNPQSDAMRQLGALMHSGFRAFKEKLEEHDQQLAEHEDRIQSLEADRAGKDEKIAQQDQKIAELQSQLQSLVRSQSVPQKSATAYDLVEKQDYTRTQAASLMGYSTGYTGKLVKMHKQRLGR
ncbi:hypothetical protein [Paraburkholderia xenovorans]|nr:hypothetical protein [Paraburkholderia xenovorans]